MFKYTFQHINQTNGYFVINFETIVSIQNYGSDSFKVFQRCDEREIGQL